MLASKTPTPACAVRILNTLGVLVLILFLSAALIAVSTDIPPTGYITRWPPLTDPLEPIGMWWAPFNGPAESGAIGAVLIVLGFGQRNLTTIPFIAGGGVILFYAGTLAAALGLGVALLILLFGFARTSPYKPRIQIGAAAIALLGLAVLVQELVRNPTLSSRTFIWSEFIALIQANPISGWGSAALIHSEVTWTFPWGEARTVHGSDAHNLLLDAWARYGLVGVLVVAGIIVTALLLAIRGYQSGHAVGPALIVMTLVIGITEHNVWWGSPGTAILILVLSITATSTRPSRAPMTEHSSRYDT
jgi:O-antigen ligase